MRRRRPVPLARAPVRARRLRLRRGFADVRINDRAINMACISTVGMYQRPRNDSVVVHFLKRPAGVRYVWGLLHDGVGHDATNCTRYVWHDNCEGREANHPFCRDHKQ